MVDRTYQLSIDNGKTWVGANTDNRHTFTGLTNNTNYSVLLKATNKYGSSKNIGLNIWPQTETTIYCGKAGKDCSWTLREDTGALVISGSGEADPKTWEEYTGFMETVDIEEGIAILPHQHLYSGIDIPPTCNEDGCHKDTCMYCDYTCITTDKGSAAHTERPGYIITQPTVVDGSMAYECDVCGNVRIVVIPAIVSADVVDLAEGAGNYKFISSQGDVYLGSKLDNGHGLRKFNPVSKSFTLVGDITTPELMTFFEDSKGNIYISGNSANTGIYHINTSGAITKLVSSGYGWTYFYEDSRGNVYASSSNSSSPGLYHLNGNVATFILTTGSSWRYFYEDSQGNVYMGSGNNASYGLYHLNGTTVTLVLATGYGWQYFFEDSNGNVYAGGSSAPGLHYFTSNVTVQTLVTGNFWRYFFEDSQGNVYAGSDSNNTGLYHLSADVATQILTTGSSWKFFFEDGKGNVYLSSGIGTSLGLYHIARYTVREVMNSGYNWKHFFEDSKGNVYVGGNHSTSLGLYHLNGGIATQIMTTGYDWQFFFEDSQKNTYVSSSASNSLGLYHLNGTTATQVHATGYNWQYFFEDSTSNVFMASSSVISIYRLNGTTTATQVHPSYNNWQYWEEKNNQVTVSTSFGVGEFIWDSSTQSFVLNPEVPSDYSGGPFGMFTWNAPGVGTATKVWYGKDLMLTNPTRFQGPADNGKVSISVDDIYTPTKMLIVKLR